MIRKLGKYVIVEKLGEGSMGAVYRAYDAVLERHVAIKTMAEEIKWDPELKLRFYREARAAANLRHPNIVTIHDLGEEGKITYIVMELLEGRDLKSFIDNRIPLPLENKLSIIAQVADGLDHAHKQGIVHRDIKPANISVGPSGNVRILDFGIARLPSSDLTSLEARLGTPVYMSPEQIRGERYDQSSDQFATGIVFYELITYVHPFRDRKLAKTLENILYQDSFAFEQQCPDAPPGLWPIIRTCLAKDPGKRFATMADLARACRDLLGRPALTTPAIADEGSTMESVSSLLAQGQEALSRKDFVAAKLAAQEARRLDPASPQVAPLLERIDEAKERTRRKEEAAMLLVKVEESILNHDLEQAEDYARQALAVVPGHERALECLNRLAQARKDEARDRKVAQFAAEAMKALDRGDLVQAASCVHRMQELDAHNSAARNLLLLVDQAGGKIRADRIRTLLRRAHEAQEAWEFLKAGECAREVLRIDGANADALRLLTDLGEAPAKHGGEKPAAVPGAGRQPLPAWEPKETHDPAETVAAADAGLEEASSALKESGKATIFLGDKREREKSSGTADRGAPASSSGGDAAAGWEETVLLEQTRKSRTARMVALSVLAILVAAVILGLWHFVRHRSVSSGRNAGLTEPDTGQNSGRHSIRPSPPDARESDRTAGCRATS